MRSVRRYRKVLGIPASILIVAVAGVGCGRPNAATGGLPGTTGRPGSAEIITGEGVLPGVRRAADGPPTATTARPRPPIGRTSSPVPSTVPVTRPPATPLAGVTT